MRWILVVSMAAALAPRGLAATDAQCIEILQHALDAKNPETRQQAVAALSLASGRGPLFDQLERMLQDKDVGGAASRGGQPGGREECERHGGAAQGPGGPRAGSEFRRGQSTVGPP